MRMTAKKSISLDCDKNSQLSFVMFHPDTAEHDDRSILILKFLAYSTNLGTAIYILYCEAVEEMKRRKIHASFRV
jgi:hypothetical protein